LRAPLRFCQRFFACRAPPSRQRTYGLVTVDHPPQERLMANITGSSVSGSKTLPPAAAARAAADSADDRFVRRVSDLATNAAQHLGLQAQAATTVGQEGLIAVGERVVAIMPVLDGGNGKPCLMLCVDSGIAIAGMDSDRISQVLQMTSGLLAAFSAAIGSSPEGHWVIYRSLAASQLQSRDLAEAILSSVRLVDFVFEASRGEGS
jgi:hypothetical protein